MTTQVFIRSPSPNHQDLMVCAVNPTTKEVTSTHRLHEGEELGLYLHSNQGLTITEVAKEAIKVAAE
jgi:hypothetical protein